MAVDGFGELDRGVRDTGWVADEQHRGRYTFGEDAGVVTRRSRNDRVKGAEAQ